QLPNNAIIVAKDGSGKYNTVQAAINSLSKSSSSERVIFIKNGKYNEQVTIQKDYVTLIGENKDKVIITYNLNNAKTGSSSECATVKVKAPFPGSNAQAPAFYSYGEKHYIENCNFLSYQDTLLSYHGTHYFKNCYIRGLTDFIWGFGRAVFEKCILHVVSKGGKNTGYLTANGNEDANFKNGGFLITNSKVNSDGAQFYLGRLWKKNCYVIFDRTEFPGDKIVKEGWLTFTGNDNYKYTSKVGEYQCQGSNYSINGRVSWSTKFNTVPSISSFLGGDLSFISKTVYKSGSNKISNNNNNYNKNTTTKKTTVMKITTKKISTAKSSNNNCGNLYSQCGGYGFTGATCCKQGKCVRYNDWYSQCVLKM
ncbi:carbohydrate-binding module family 1 protein, partial [Piromyces sp. E2]